jgi:hypothetical protein
VIKESQTQPLGVPVKLQEAEHILSWALAGANCWLMLHLGCSCAWACASYASRHLCVARQSSTQQRKTTRKLCCNRRHSVLCSRSLLP